ncbi:MAG TPA: hypothetical protein VI122_04705 [Thermoleophilaceae bacterium]
MTRTALLRIALVAVALLAGAWIVLSLRSVELESDGRAVLAKAQRGPITASELSRGRSLLQRAGRFSADQGPRIVEGVLLDSAHRPEEAAATAERVVEDEPDNVDGWIVLYLALSHRERRPRDTGRAAEALRMVRSLNPLAEEVLRPPRSGGSS